MVCAILLSSAVLVIAGCGRDDVKVYRVAKEPPAPRQVSSQSALPHGHPDVGSGGTAKPQLSWALPEGWQEAPSRQMILATFNITGKTGQQAQVTVTPLASLAGKEAAIVNMWRQTVGLPELSSDEAEKQLKPVKIGDAPGKMFEVSGKADGAARPAKIVTAMMHRPEASWFFKLVGDDEVVEAQRPLFIAFLKSIKIGEAPAAETASSGTTTTPQTETPAGNSKWKIPEDWKVVPPGPMQVAKFSVPSKGSAKADMMISVFPTDTGGTLGNVNRWRNQIGLPPVSEPELAKLVTKLDEKNPDALLVDMTNNERRLIGAIVPRDGQWYFFKLLGDDAAVAPQKEAFIAFAKSPQ